jgi:putative aldouronate transport system permease protein
MSKITALDYIKKNRALYLMLLPGIVYYVIFHYIPMYGVTIAFKDFNIMKGMIRSPWIGFEHFRYLFSLDKFLNIFNNTVIISLQRLVFGFPAPIIMSLLMNELGSLKFKKFVQTSIFLPHFISWVILGGILINLLSIDNGIINQIRIAFGKEPLGFLTDEAYFRGTLVFSMIWKEYGWGTIIYIAALAGVDPNLYEAAIVDGCNRFKLILHITLPAIKSTIIIILILRLGRLMQAGFEQIFILYHPGVYRVSDIIDTYVYRIGLGEGRFSLATAVGLFKSVINMTLLIISNKLARQFGEQGIY